MKTGAQSGKSVYFKLTPGIRTKKHFNTVVERKVPVSPKANREPTLC